MVQVSSATFNSNGIVIVRPKPTLILTRPIFQSQDFLRAFGTATNTILSPLNSIEFHSEIPNLTDAQLLLFSSANGVRALQSFGETPNIPTLSVGENTASAARDAGFSTISANGTAADLLALAQLTYDPSKGPIIHVSGANVTLDLAVELTRLNIPARREVLYHQAPTPLGRDAIHALENDITVLPVFSANAATRLITATRTLNLLDATALCISQTAATPLENSDFLVQTTSRPTRANMIQSLRSLLKVNSNPY